MKYTMRYTKKRARKEIASVREYKMDKQITLRIPIKTYEALKEMSKKTGLNITSLIVLAMNLEIKNFSNIHQLQ